MMAACGTNSRNSPSCFAPCAPNRLVTPVMFPPGRLRLCGEAQPHGVFREVDHEGNFRGRRLGHQRRRLSAARDDDSNLPADQILRQRWHAAILAASPAIFDRDVLSLDVARFTQAGGMRPASARRFQAISC